MRVRFPLNRVLRDTRRDVTGGGRQGVAAAVGYGPGEALRFPRLRPDQDICEGRGLGEGRVILKVRPRVQEKGFRNIRRPLAGHQAVE